MIERKMGHAMTLVERLRLNAAIWQRKADDSHPLAKDSLEAAEKIESLSRQLEEAREALKDLSAWKEVIRQNLIRLDPTYDHTKFDAEWDEKINAARAIAQPVGDGWKLVPVEPTEAMIDAAISAGSETEGGGYESATEREIYRAMLAAAPVSPVISERREALEEAANAMLPMLRDMISRGWAYDTILALKDKTP